MQTQFIQIIRVNSIVVPVSHLLKQLILITGERFCRKTTQGINLITNKDLTPPFVVKARATDVSGSLINILSNFSIRFSEPVDETTLSTGTCYLSDGTKTYGGSYTVLETVLM